jgi:hypothetical protein
MREGISANEFTLFPLEKSERDIIYNEKENDERRKSCGSTKPEPGSYSIDTNRANHTICHNKMNGDASISL